VCDVVEATENLVPVGVDDEFGDRRVVGTGEREPRSAHGVSEELADDAAVDDGDEEQMSLFAVIGSVAGTRSETMSPDGSICILPSRV